MTKAERERMAKIKESGCLACILAAGKTRPPDVHHLTKGGRRTGDTVGLCPYHHRGVITDGLTWQQEMGLVGPSFAHGRREWEDFFGDDAFMLAAQDRLLHHSRNPWHNYVVPRAVVLDLQDMWHKYQRSR